MAKVLVTGAAGGIGTAACEYFAARGHEVLAHVRTEERARALAANRGWTPVWGDLTKAADVAAMAGQVEAAGGVDWVIHNAGILSRDRTKGPHGVGIQAEVNVIAPFTLTKALAAQLRASEDGRVLVMTSSAANFAFKTDYDRLAEPDGSSLFGQYALSKAAANALTVAMARLFPDIQVVATEPGFVTTDMTAGNPSMPWLMAKLAQIVGTTPERATARSFDAWLAGDQPSGTVLQSGQPVTDKRWDRDEAQAALGRLFERAGVPLQA